MNSIENVNQIAKLMTGYKGNGKVWWNEDVDHVRVYFGNTYVTVRPAEYVISDGNNIPAVYISKGSCSAGIRNSVSKYFDDLGIRVR